MFSPVLHYKSLHWKEDAIRAVSKNGNRLRDAPEAWRSDRDVVRAAVKQNPLAIRYAPLFHEDKELMMLSTRLNGLAHVWTGVSLYHDSDLQIMARKRLPKEYRLLKAPGPPRIFISRPLMIKSITGSAAILEQTQPLLKTHSCFIRDSQVTLFSGKHLIPYPAQNPLVVDRVISLIPSLSEHLIIKQRKNLTLKIANGVIGQGYKIQNVAQAMITNYDNKIPFRKAATCIEGGNCFLFLSQGKRKAIVGEISVRLSMVALEEQGYFEGKEPPLEERDRPPSEEAYRMARNSRLFYYRDHLLKSESEVAYRKRLLSPLSQGQRERYASRAREIEGKLTLTRMCIAKELEIPLENIAFVPQAKFHIDMEMNVTPSGVVLLHDHQKTVSFLNRIAITEKLKPQESELLKRYHTTANQASLQFSQITKIQKEILQKQGIEFRLMPAVFEDRSSKSALNYCNGIFLPLKKKTVKSHLFITTGTSLPEEVIFHRKFIELFERTFPSFSIVSVPNMSKFISKHHGGVHCLSSEETLIFE